MKKQEIDHILARMLDAYDNVSDLNITVGKPFQVETSGELAVVDMDPPFHEITPFQALTSTLAATIGNGNIAGVATAVAAGGPGALVWMWLTALVGMCTKMCEATLGVKYRIKDKDGALAGGSMYFIKKGLGQAWLAVFGDRVAIPELYNIGGVTFILSLAGFSYVFLLVRTALEQSNPNLEEAARIQGASPWQVFWRVNLPLLRPAIAAGLSLVVLHVLSDFGAVSMLRYQTFTLSIYLQMSSRFDYQGAAGLSMVLVMLSLMFLVLERFSRRKQRYYASAQQRQAALRPATAFEQVLIWAWLGLITLFAFALPLAWMLDWSWQAWRNDLIDITFWGYVSNSLTVAAVVATLAIVCAFPVAFFHTRKHSLLSTSYLQLSSIGFVLPGPVIALGVLSFILAVLAPLYGGLAALFMALVVRFLPLAVQSQEASLQQLTPSIEQAGRSLGAGPLENLRRVILPMIRGGMAGAWVLVFIDAMKELPATLILRPTGFDTLPVRIWIEASEEMLELAAPAALMLVIGTLPALWLMMRGEKKRS